jgi:hypothetical protein
MGSRSGPASIALASLLIIGLPARAAPAVGDGSAAGLPAVMSPEIVKSITAGLDYLAKVQQPNGSCPARYDGRDYPAAMTAFAGLAWLASGSTPAEGPYAENLRRAMLFLMGLGDSHPDGLIAGTSEARCTYGHGLGMLLLAQCYGMEQTDVYEKGLKHTLDRAIKLVALGQSSAGGWLYSPVGRGGDEGSTTACILQGLRACRNAGLKVPTETIDRAVGYLQHCQNPDGGIAYSSVSRGASHLPISAAAIVCYYSAGVYDRKAGGTGAESVYVERLWRYVNGRTNVFASPKPYWTYTNFYLAQALFVRGGPEWERYYGELAKDYLARQAKNGSWPGEDAGPVYGTAIACFVLQLPYGCLPVCQR